MLDFLKSGTFRRIVAGLLAVVVPLLNQKFGLNLDDVAIGGFLLTMVGYIVAGNAKEAAVAKADAHVEAANVIAGKSVSDPLPTPDMRGRSPSVP